MGDKMINLENIMNRYNETYFSEVSINYTTFTLYSLEKIKSINPPSANCLIIGDEDLCGDLIAIDTNIDSLPVYLITLDYELEPDYISSSIDNFIQIMIKLKELSIDRETPIEFEQNPISDQEKNEFLKQIRCSNLDCDMQFWEELFAYE